MMLLAGDFARTDCLKKKEDSIDLYNKCRGRQPLKKMAENYIKPGPEGNIERGRQPHKKMVKSYQNYIKPGSESNIERGRQPHKKMVKSYQNYIKPLSEIHIKPLSEMHMKPLSDIYIKQFSENCVKPTVKMFMKPESDIHLRYIIPRYILLSDILFSLHMMSILLLAGDIERNPGPRMKKPSANVKNRVDRERKHQERHNESPETKSRRLESDRKRKVKIRESESPETKSRRLENDRKRKVETRGSETPETKSGRLESDRKRKVQTRASETKETKSRRLESDRKRKVHTRASETPKRKSRRLQTVKQKMAENRASETPETKSRRLQTVKEKMTENRASETPETKSRRLQTVKEKMRENRASETPETKSRRLQTVKEKMTENRASETPETKSRRLQTVKEKMTENRASETPETKSRRLETVKEKMAKKRHAATLHVPSIQQVTEMFQEKVKLGPVHVCTSCHRLMYRESVVKYEEKKYEKLSHTQIGQALQKFLYKSTDSNIWICTTCHRKLKQGKIPAQSKINNLDLDVVPDELSELNSIEIRLLSKRIPFMKMVALPRGRQTAIHGPAVNIPTNLDTICKLLPRLPKDSEILPMKLKRRLCYKGHYMYDSVHPERMMMALDWLKANNILYGDININDVWTEEWENADPELWKAISGIEVSDKPVSESGVPQLVSKKSSEISPAITPHTMEHLQRMCESRGFQIENVAGDGHCFYRSVQQQLLHILGINENHVMLRKLLAEFLDKHPNGPNGDVPYRQFVGNRLARTQDTGCETAKDLYIETLDVESDRTELRWQRYLQDLEQGSWADHIAVQGMADMLHVSLRIIATHNPATVVEPRDGNNIAVLNLGLIGQTHYVSLKSVKCSEPIGSGHREEKNIGTEKCQHDVYDAEQNEEAEAFEEMSKLRGLPLDTCLQVDTLDANSVVSVAPGEGQKPLNILSDKDFEEMAFPQKYPYGKGGFSAERCENLTMRRYFNQRLLDVDGRFSGDVEYLLAAQYAAEYQQINSLTSVVMRQVPGRIYRGQRVTAGDLKDPTRLSELIQTDKAYKLLKQVRGTPAYWQKVHYDVLAMIRQLGIPTWFLTLSAAEMKWPEVIQIIARQYGEILSDEAVCNMTWEDKTTWLKRNPVTAARHFQYRLDQFWKTFITSKAKPIGEVTDYMIRIEFQARGSPHAHTILWIKDAPQYGKDSDEKVTEFIDKYQVCSYPHDNEELQSLVQLQKHTHSSSCLRYGLCRFGIPKMPSPVTLISSEPENADDKVKIVNGAKQVFSQVQKILDEISDFENVTLDHVLEASRVTMEEYIGALNVSKNGHSVVLQRKLQEMNINNYNPAVLRAWRANMDIQFILDAYACVVYVTSYMMKSERAMGELLKQVVKETRGDDIRTQLRKLGTTFLNHREVSAQETVFRLLSMPLKRQSRTVVFINTDPKNERATMTKPMSAINSLEDDDEDLYQTSLIDRYAARPDSLENMCLAEFAANYTADSFSLGDDDGTEHTPNTMDEPHDTPRNIIHLKNGIGKMHKRKQEAIIRFHKYNVERESEKYYRAKLMLYISWRDEDVDIIGDKESFYERYTELLEEVVNMEEHYSHNAQTLEQAQEALLQAGPPEHAWANVAPNAEHNRLQEEEEGNIDETYMDNNDLEENADLLNRERQCGVVLRYETQIDPNIMSNEEYCTRMRNLNDQQRQIVLTHIKWCKSLIQASKQGKPAPKPYHLYISGSGGVGKSYVISLLRHITIKYLRYLPHVTPSDLLCLTCAPTGTAAFNINGMTIHSAFLIPITMKAYQNLGTDTLNTLRNKLQHLKVVIIDEISMVSSTLLYYIHRRLQEIKGCQNNQSTFGDVTVIAVGDFYQLKPVKNSFVFELPNDGYAALHDPLWYQFKFTELTQIMRQKDDKRFAALLNRVRTNSCTEKDIRLLKSRIIAADSSDYPFESLHVYTTWKNVNKYNTKMMSTLPGTVYTLKSIDTKIDTNSGVEVRFSNRASDTGGLLDELQLVAGCRVMLKYNIDVSDGLVNGATGKVLHIVLLANSVTTILVEFDNQEIGRRAKQESHFKQDYPTAVPISRVESRFNIGNRHAISACRRQFPLVLAWATTIHKVQGLTTDNIVVSFQGAFLPGQAYVALSRVKNLNGLHILDFDPKKIRVNEEVNEEMDRLKEQCSSADLEMQTFPTCDFTLSHLNIHGIKAHMKDLQMENVVLKSDILCFCETFLQGNDKFNEYSLRRSHMDIFRIEREIACNIGSGGILMAVNRVLKPTLVTGTISDDMEQVTVKVEMGSTVFCITCVYRPPSGSVKHFIKQTVQLVDELQQVYPSSSFIIVGDFNEDILQGSNNISSFFSSIGFEQYTKSATRDSGTLLDHTYVKATGYSIRAVVHDTYYSDHDVVSVHFSRE